MKNCIMCISSNIDSFLRVADKHYLRCATCFTTFLESACRLTRQEELAHYQHHENDPDDKGYRKFLSKLAFPLLERIDPKSGGLDYGCGPGSALVAIFEEAGHDMSVYDPFFAPEKTPLSGIYDFITCTETAEHFHEPAVEFERLKDMLRPSGWLGIMSCFQTDDEKFATWHYRTDPTHVVFYKEETFHWLANRWGWNIEIPSKDVVLMQKPAL